MSIESAMPPLGDGQVAPPTPQGESTPTPDKSGTQGSAPSGQADPKAPNLEGAPDTWEYDGNPNTVPPQFQKFAKGLQRHFTQRSMTEAEVRRKGQEYDQFVQSEDYKAFQAWRQQQQSNGQPAAPQGQPQNPTLISQNEWEEAQLDPTGMRAQALIDRVVQARLQEAVQAYGGQLQQLQHTQQRTEFNSTLSDYADANPDVIELHEMGLMKPLLEEEMASRKHRTYEAAISAAHQRASQARDSIRARVLQEQQQLVNDKRNAVVNNGTGSGEQTVVHVDKGDAFATAFENAANGKKIKNKLK